MQGTKELLLKVMGEQIEDAEFYNSNYCKMTPVWVFKDALELLQPADELEPSKNPHQWDKCNYCGNYVFNKWKWCPYCGGEIDWRKD